MPKPMEHNSINQDSHLNQGCLSKYKNLGEKSVKVKMPKKLSVHVRDINFINLKPYLISHLIL